MVRQYAVFVIAGAIPFVAAATVLVAGMDTLGPVRSVSGSLVAYGLAIASFVAGSHWGLYLQHRPADPPNLFVTSNAAVLVPWLAFVVGPTHLVLIALILTFSFLALVDWRLHAAGLIDSAYFHLRIAATAIVCLALLTVLVFR